MKEKIEKKLEENIERILNKEELLATDVAILEEELSRIKSAEESLKYKEKMAGILDLEVPTQKEDE